MAASKQNIPVLRFPEFSGKWKEKRIGELCFTFKSGVSITSRDIKESGKFPVYGGNGLRGYSDKYTHDGFYFLIGRQGALCGNINRTNGKVYISEHAIAVQGNGASDTEWLAQRLDYYNLNRLSESSAQPGLSVNKLVRYKLCVPDQGEQQKIADFLTAVDGKIGLLSKQKDVLEQYKKGVMQKLFSQSLRFTNKDGTPYPDWEEKRAYEVFENYSNKNHDGTLPILAVTQDDGVIKRDALDKQIQTTQKSILSYKVVEKGNFVISLRSFQGGIEFSEIKGICSPAYTILRAKLVISNAFFKYYFKKESFISQLSAAVIGIRDGKQISYSVFSAMKLRLPCLEEQQKIAEFLSSLDQKISHISQQLSQAQAFKKGLLQQMFV